MTDPKKVVFPFRSVLDLTYLIKYWEDSVKQSAFPALANEYHAYLEKAPELQAPIEDLSILSNHTDFISFLISAAMPSATQDTELAAAILPFQFKSVYTTPAFTNRLSLETLEEDVTTNLPGNSFGLGKTIRACLMILEKFYGITMPYDRPILFTSKNQDTGLDHVYKVEINSQFCDIKALKKPNAIDPKVIKFLLEKIYDVDLWLQYIQPDQYEFHGIMVMRLVDVTVQEMLSSIKYDLLEKDAVIRKESFAAIQQKLRSLFGIAEIQLGIAYFDPNNNLVLNSDTADCWKSLADISMDNNCGDYTGSVHERSWIEKRFLAIENLDEYPYQSAVEKSLLANGIKNILLAPLVDGEETIGMLELATPIPGKLNSMSFHKVESILPMFTSAVKRVKDEMSTEVRALIQEECTAIHPTVQWRFFEAGVNLMNKRKRGEDAVMEEIVFKDVFPLYGLADVRNSSLERNNAIREDLLQNLKLVKGLLLEIYAHKKLPLVEEVIFRTEDQLEKLKKGLNSGDESKVLEFLRSEINPLLTHFENDSVLIDALAIYRSYLDPTFGVVYKRRKSFEESLKIINETISGCLLEAEKRAQEMFPHYFEKYKTDGIEFTLYVGSSLVKNQQFNLFYLRNFRLWQLLTMIEIDRRMDLLKPSLKNKLEITQLILAHDQSVSIRFRADEKQFDVDGAYDIRYEIIKKRIDKALVKNTQERLTQPGKIAVVYNQGKSEFEYRKYFEYLSAKGLIASEIEEVELEELPGAFGLRALRVSITKSVNIDVAQDNLLQNIKEALNIS